MRLLFGRLRVPGWVLLHDQPPSPWLLPGRLPAAEAKRLQGAGAYVEPLNGGHTRVTWPGDTLRQFMLMNVLLHEIGHHLVQQYTGKRSVRNARTSEHELLAERFAARCRAQLLITGVP
jgi:hypothetical protein